MISGRPAGGAGGAAFPGGGVAGGGGARGNTTICQFNSGPRNGTRFDFAPYGVQPIPVGAPYQDGHDATGIAVR